MSKYLMRKRGFCFRKGEKTMFTRVQTAEDAVLWRCDACGEEFWQDKPRKYTLHGFEVYRDDKK